jgi:hypothetical protein
MTKIELRNGTIVDGTTQVYVEWLLPIFTAQRVEVVIRLSNGAASQSASWRDQVDITASNRPTSRLVAIPLTALPTGPLDTLNVLATYTTLDDAGEALRLWESSVPVSPPAASTLKPTISAVADIKVNALGSLYLQNRSRAIITTTAAGKYGATIQSYSVYLNGSLFYQGASNSPTTPVFTQSGTNTITVTATDSRGITSDVFTKTITVTAYSPPSIASCLLQRCTSAGALQSDGLYARLLAVVAHSAVTGNAVTTTLGYKLSSASAWTTVSGGFTSNTAKVFGGALAAASSYDVRLTATDTAGNTATYIDTLGVAVPTLDLSAGGLGIGLLASAPASGINIGAVAIPAPVTAATIRSALGAEPKIAAVETKPANYYRRGDNTWAEKVGGGIMFLAQPAGNSIDQGSAGSYARCLLDGSAMTNTSSAYFSMASGAPAYFTVLKACRLKISGALAIYAPTGAAVNQVAAGAIMVGTAVIYQSRATIRNDDYLTIPLSPYITDVAANTQIGLGVYRSGSTNIYIQTGSFILAEVIEAVV